MEGNKKINWWKIIISAVGTFIFIVCARAVLSYFLGQSGGQSIVLAVFFFFLPMSIIFAPCLIIFWKSLNSFSTQPHIKLSILTGSIIIMTLLDTPLIFVYEGVSGYLDTIYRSEESGLFLQSNPSFTPSGKKIIFAAIHKNEKQIFISDIDGSQTFQLTRMGNNFAPNISNDSSKITYISTRDNSQGEIYIMDISGSNQRRLTYNYTTEFYPSFSTDDIVIIYAKQISHPNAAGMLGQGLFKIRTNGSGSEQRIFNLFSPNYGNNFRFSKKEKSVTIITEKKEISFIDISKPNLVINKKSFNCDWPTLSPDETKFLYIEQTSGKYTYDLFIEDIDGNNSVQLTDMRSFLSNPVFSQEGHKVLFLSHVSGEIYELWQVNSDGSDLAHIDINFN